MSEKLKFTEKQIFQIINYRLDKKNENLFSDRFDVVFDDIPSEHPDQVYSGCSRHDYCEDDGREYRWFIFKDKTTNEEFIINSLYHSEYDNEIMDLPDNICIVSEEKESSLYASECKNKIIDAPGNICTTPEQEKDVLNETKLTISFLSPELKKSIFNNKVSDQKTSIEIKNNDDETLTPSQRLKKAYEKIESECSEFKTNATLSQIPSAKIGEIIKFLNQERGYSFNDIIEKVYPLCIEYKLNQKSFWQWLQVKRGAWKQK